MYHFLVVEKKEKIDITLKLKFSQFKQKKIQNLKREKKGFTFSHFIFLFKIFHFFYLSKKYTELLECYSCYAIFMMGGGGDGSVNVMHFHCRNEVHQRENKFGGMREDSYPAGPRNPQVEPTQLKKIKTDSTKSINAMIN